MRRERVLAHLDDPLPLELESREQLREFRRSVLKRMLAGAVDPQIARAASALAAEIAADAPPRTDGTGRRTRAILERLPSSTPPSEEQEVPQTTSAVAP
jgi:hypothetical protein